MFTGTLILTTLLSRIDKRGVIKVADFGLTEDMYDRNYFRHDKSEEGCEKVPIRWMAPESIESDVYNERTDIVRIIELACMHTEYESLSCVHYI